MGLVGVQAVIALHALFFLFTGVQSFRHPGVFARALGLTVDGTSGEIEVRAQYGGFFFVAGTVQLTAFAGAIPLSSALFISLVVFGGLIAGRVGAIFVRQRGEKISSLIRWLYFIDAIGFISAAAALIPLHT